MNAARSDRRALARALVDAERLVATLRQALAVFPSAAPGEPFIDEDEIALKTAAHLAKRSPDCVRRWCIAYRIGWKRGGQWIVSRRALISFLDKLKID